MAFTAFSSAPTSTGGANGTEPAGRKRSWIALVLLLPGILYLLLFFIAPLISLIFTSFQQPVIDGDIGQYSAGFQWQNYTDAVGQYLPLIFRAFGYAILATVFALVISYPMAYFIGVKMRRWPLAQSLLLTLVIAPFFISFLLRTLAWKQLFSDEGPVVPVLKALSVLPTDGHITGTPFAVVFGLTYNFIPFMTLPLYAVLERMDTRYIEAGADLYASPWTTFRKVTVPLSMPGIVSGTLLTFIPAAGDYINASNDFLGSSQTSMVGNAIEANFLVLQNYPIAAALSIVLMAVILIIVGIYVRRAGTEDLI
ncbi:ABC transporter permease [Subtercola endophyticus]|uniref:ABC transporter permease n=1 Tax=Subtercola endophyticus TaxID=2895559 RepID=UPI001E53AF8E|nr:ABC transporter permease [Subtercola endophyticus]UFS60064.1 ABC transporter permease [Subtercola endophyticus]